MTKYFITAIALFAVYGLSAGVINTGKKGYWNYEITPTKTLETTKTIKANPLPERPKQPPVLPPEAALMQMHPAQIKVLIKQWRGRAIETLAPKDVQSYLLVQNVARKKAVGYAAVVGLVTQVDPNLSLKKDVPVTNAGKSALYSKRKREVDGYLASIRERYALLYFVDKSCAFCRVQDGILRQYQNKYGWTIKPIELSQRPDLGAQFGVEITPSLIMVSNNQKDWIPVSYGVTSLPELVEGIYRGAKLLTGNIAPAQFYTNQEELGGGLDPLSTPKTSPLLNKILEQSK